jgi:hypothetical protein
MARSLPTYQDALLSRIGHIIGQQELNATVYEIYANEGRVIALDGFVHVLSLRYEFSRNTIRVNFERPGPGPVAADWFTWKPGDPASDTEVERLFARLRERLLDYIGEQPVV